MFSQTQYYGLRSLARAERPVIFSFSSQRIHISGRVEGIDVPLITVDTAGDIRCITLSFEKSHPF